MRIHRSFLAVTLIALFLASACNLPTASHPNTQVLATSVAETLSAMQTGAAVAPGTPTAGDTSTPLPTNTGIPSITPTPQNPLVIGDVLCWAGPGAAYEVVSAVKKGTRVELLGRGSIPGWWIIRNPIYHDPCWMPESSLQFDAGYNLGNLQIFYPPPTPTWTPSATPTP